MLQDSWRFAFFAAGRPAQAFLNDLVWTVLLIGALLVLAVTDRAGVVSCVLTFGGTAALAACLRLPAVPDPPAASVDPVVGHRSP